MNRAILFSTGTPVNGKATADHDDNHYPTSSPGIHSSPHPGRGCCPRSPLAPLISGLGCQANVISLSPLDRQRERVSDKST